MKQRIAIIAGGDSGEYEISIMSSAIVLKHLDHSLFDPYLVIFQGKNWFYRDDNSNEYPVSKGDFTIELPGGKVAFDGVFIAIHGTPGEDGKIQSYFDLLGIPYSTSGQTTSALTFDKFFCNNFIRSFKVNVSKSLIVRGGEHISEEEILNNISLPCFVKPNHGGSSVGTFKVKTKQELGNAIVMALKEDKQVIIEEFIPGREFSCGVIHFKEKIMALPVTEIISKNEFFDYEAKYEKMADEITPAKIPSEIAREISDTSIKLYRLLNCQGIVRFDYILNGNKLFFLEVNTVPGMSELSIVPQQAIEAGISLKELFSETMLNALNKR